MYYLYYLFWHLMTFNSIFVCPVCAHDEIPYATIWKPFNCGADCGCCHIRLVSVQIPMIGYRPYISNIRSYSMQYRLAQPALQCNVVSVVVTPAISVIRRSPSNGGGGHALSSVGSERSTIFANMSYAQLQW